MVKISIIIPVYNADKYLKRCVDSVLESMGKIKGEILLIDNNSTDQSAKTIRQFQKKYPKIVRELKCVKKGASATRNLGFKEAKGEYIWFIDADDTISKDAIHDLIAEADKTKADFVMLGANRILENGEKIYLPAFSPDDPDFNSKFIRRTPGPWEILIRREWWASHNFKFQEGMIHEDLELMPTLILHTKKIASVDRPLYTYYYTPGSVLHSEKWDAKYFDIFPALEGLYQHFKQARALEKYHDELEWFFIYNLLIDSANDFKKGGKEGRIGFRKSREMLSRYFPKWRHNRFLNQKKLGIKFKVRVLLSYYGVVV